MRELVFSTSMAMRWLSPWIYPWAFALLLASCSASINPVGGLLETDVETLPDQVVEEDETSPIVAGFKARSKAPDGTVEVTATSSDTNLMPHPTVTLNSETNTYSLAMIPTGNGSGLVTITVTVTLGSRVKQKAFTVNVVGVSRAPVIEAIADISIEQGSTLSGIEVNISDRETAATSLLVSVTSNNQTLLPDANIVLSGTGENRFLALDPIPIQNGVAVVSVTVTDSDGLSSIEEFIVTVPAAGGGGGGTPPTITPIADQTINEDSSTGSLAFTVGDADQPANTLIVSVTSSNLTVAPLSAITLTGDAVSRTVSVTPPANVFGTSTITISVTDGLLVTQETFLLTVNSVNDAPTITDIANQSVAANTSTGTVAFNISDIETALTSLTVTATSSNTTLIPNVNLTLGGTGASRNISALPATNRYGTSTITVTVNDGTTTIQDTFTVTVGEPEQTSIAFTYPHKDGFKIGESDDQAYTIHGTCAIDDVPVRFSINSGAQTASTSCTSGEWALTMNVAGLSDGTIFVATTNATTGNNKTRTFLKETAYCDAGKLAASPFAGGTGERTNPFTVCTLAQFNQISSAAADSTFLVKNNIDFTSAGNWSELTPVGDVDGGNFQLKNVTLNTGVGYSGVFRIWSASRPFTLKNIHLYNVSQNTTGGPYVGTLAGRIGGGGWHRVYNCSAHGAISGTDGDEVGGLIGWFIVGANNGRIENSFSSVDISTAITSTKVGGLVGNNEGALIQRSYYAGLINAGESTGGLVGQNSTNSPSIIESFSMGRLNQLDSNHYWLGGLVGYNSPSSKIQDSYSLADVTGGEQVGGLVGRHLDMGLRVYSSGAVSGTASLGGLVGASSSPPTNGFWNMQTSGQATSSGGTGLTNAQSQVQANYTGFDFSATGPWQMDSSLSPYPTLKWQSNPGAPTITTIADQTIDQGQATGALTFIVGDETVAASALTVTAYSTNTTLVPDGNITLGGSGANRTVTVTPDQLQSGTAWIFVDVSDGSLSDFAYFKVTVNPAQLQLSWVYPHKNGFKIGESDDNAYTVTGKCLINGLNVDFSVNSGAVTGTTACASGAFSYTFNASTLADGTITLATTNGSNGVNITRTFIKETTYCDAGKLAASPYAAGTGTPTDPHTICTRDQLAEINSSPDSRFELKNNLDMTGFGAWSAQPIERDFDGNNFQIKNFTYPGSGSPYFFVFTNAASTFTAIRNLHFYNATVTGASASTFGVVMGSAAYQSAPTGLLYNVSVNATVSSSGSFIGGIAGDLQGVATEDLYSSGSVTSTTGTAGGIAGFGAGRKLGSAAAVSGALYVGGLMGSGGGTSESYSTGSVTDGGAGGSVGGLVGALDNATMQNSYSWATVSGSGQVNGLVSFDPTGDEWYLYTNYSKGGVNNLGGATEVNGLVPGSCLNHFWDTQTSGQATSGCGTGRTTAQMYLQATYIGFDFSSTGPWQMEPSLSPYPTLKWQSNPGAPTITPIADQTLNESSSTSALAFTIGDESVAATSLTLSVASTNTFLLPTAGIVLGGSGASRTVTLTPTANRSGTADVMITVSDGSLSNFIIFKVAVSETDNDPPEISHGTNFPIVRNEDGTFSFTYSVYDDNVAVGSLTYGATSDTQSLLANGSITLGGSGSTRTLGGPYVANANGSAIVTLSVGDGTNTTNLNIPITVNAVNDAPAATGFGFPSTNEDTTWGPTAFTVGDVETAAASLTVTVTSSSNTTLVPLANVTLGGSGSSRTITVVPAANLSGSSVIGLRVSDGTANTSFAAILAVTAVNDAPTITDIANQTIDEDSATSALPFTIGDVETVATSLSVSATSSNQTLLPNANLSLSGSGASRTITATPAADQTGTATVTVTVGDGTTTTNDTFTLTVNNLNDAPTISAIANQTLLRNNSSGALLFTVGDLETSTSSLTLSATSSNTTLVPVANILFSGSGANRSVVLSPATNQTGTSTITVTVSDGTTTASEPFDVTVSATESTATLSLTLPSLLTDRLGYVKMFNGFCSDTGELVEAFWGATSLGGATCDGDNRFEIYADTSALPVGDHVLTVEHEDSFGNRKVISTPTLNKYSTACDTLAARQKTYAQGLAGGAGTAASPYIICTSEQLRAIDLHENDYFQLANDIYFTRGDTNGDNVVNGSDQDYLSGSGWAPLDSSGYGGFKAGFFGNRFMIQGLTISRGTTDNVGLFKWSAYAFFRNLRFVDPSVTGRDNVGILGGEMSNTAVYDVHVIGSQNAYGYILGRSSVGGLVGNAGAFSIFSKISAAVSLTASSSKVGGIVGQTTYGGAFHHIKIGSASSVIGTSEVGGINGKDTGRTNYTNSYNDGSIYGTSSVGGIVGESSGVLENVYNTGVVTGTGDYVGGISGQHWVGGIFNSFNTGNISGASATNEVGYIVGTNNNIGSVLGFSGNYYLLTATCTDTNATGGTCNSDGSTTQIENLQDNGRAVYNNWDFEEESGDGPSDTWYMSEANTFPKLFFEKDQSAYVDPFTGDGTAASPYLIANETDFGKIKSNPRYSESYFRLTGNINLSLVSSFEPLFRSAVFAGDFDGDDYDITNFSYTETKRQGLGLFHHTSMANIHDLYVNVSGTLSGSVSGLAITNIGVLGSIMNGKTAISRVFVEGAGSIISAGSNGHIGGLVAGGVVAISRSYVDLDISGTANTVGGLAGELIGSSIANSYHIGTIAGSYYVGGVAGMISYSATVDRSFHSGTITATDTGAGGVVGYAAGSTVTNSFGYGNVTGSNAGSATVGLVVGLNGGSTVGATNYYYTAFTCTNSGGGSCNTTGTGSATASDFYTPATGALTNYDFSTIWTDNSGTTSLPTLQ